MKTYDVTARLVGQSGEVSVLGVRAPNPKAAQVLAHDQLKLMAAPHGIKILPAKPSADSGARLTHAIADDIKPELVFGTPEPIRPTVEGGEYVRY